MRHGIPDFWSHPQTIWGQKTRFRSSLNSTAVLNLNCPLVFFFMFFSLYFLEKSTKNGAAVSGIRCFLCSRVALRHLSVGAHLAARRLSQCLGWQELASLKHHATCFQALLGYSLCLPTLPFRLWRGITFCNEQAHRIVILNTGWNCAELSKQKNAAFESCIFLFTYKFLSFDIWLVKSKAFLLVYDFQYETDYECCDSKACQHY